MKSKHIWNKVIALCLTLSLVFGMSLTAFADDQNGGNVISEIHFSGVPEMGADVVVGGSAPSLSGIQIGGEHDVVISESYWQEGGSPLNSSFVFEEGNKYYLFLKVISGTGYVFAEDLHVYVNGRDYGYFAGYADTEFVFNVDYSFLNKIDKVEVTGIPTAKIGETASVTSIKVPDNANYVIDTTNTMWYDLLEHEARPMSANESFQNGHKYKLSVYIQPKEGFEFLEDDATRVDVGGLEADYQHCWPKELCLEFVTSFFSVLPDEELKVTVGEPQVGKTVDSVSVKVPDGAKYKVDYVNWYEYSSGNNMGPTDVFEAGHRYEADINLVPVLGYTFNENAVILVNGEESESYDVQDEHAWSYYKFSFCNQIDKIEISGVQQPKVGDKVNYASIKVPDNADYIITSKQWADSDGSTLLAEGDTFQKGHKYYFDVCVEPKEGYEFSEDAIMIVNGEAVGADNSWIDYEFANYYTNCSFLEKITKVEILDAFPKAVVGKTVSDVLLQIPDGSNYSVSASWIESSQQFGQNSLQPGAVFEDGHTYWLRVEIMPNAGYEFSDDVVITVAGKETQPTLGNVDNGYISFFEVNDFANRTIDVIELSVTEPKAGDKISKKSVKVPDNANYALWDVRWVDAVTGRDVKGTFEEGKKYQLRFHIETLNGYVFGNELKIKVNNQEMDLKSFSEDTFLQPDWGYLELTYDLSVQEVVKSPNTGDGAAYGLWAIVMILCAGYAVLTFKKRRNG